ncbi:MAG TPA: PASTA domain-containing protein [Pyrinomonadaceae bacterium]|nr:PASTA domain-containing protein [Pyrinomonadaceae bacterium]
MIGIAIAFLFGLATTVYLSLRSPEVKVPDVVGKNRFDAEKILAGADLNFRVRATRPSNQAQPDTVLFQLPRPGEVVKTGQTVAMDISRAAKEGETPETVKPEEESSENSNSNANTATNLNENKPKKPKNKNANDNLNGNANSNANVNRPVNANRTPNANRPNVDATPDNSNTIPRTNINRVNSNTRTNSNQNENRRPIAPKPSPGGVTPPN